MPNGIESKNLHTVLWQKLNVPVSLVNLFGHSDFISVILSPM